jgi:hypothetical protein
MAKRTDSRRGPGPRRRLLIAGAAGLLAAAFGVGLLSRGSQPSPAAAGSTTAQAPPLAPVAGEASGQVVDGISAGETEQLAFHIHAHLAVYVNGEQHPIPLGIGVLPPLRLVQTSDGPFVVGGAAFYWLHTHDLAAHPRRQRSHPHRIAVPAPLHAGRVLRPLGATPRPVPGGPGPRAGHRPGRRGGVRWRSPRHPAERAQRDPAGRRCHRALPALPLCCRALTGAWSPEVSDDASFGEPREISAGMNDSGTVAVKGDTKTVVRSCDPGAPDAVAAQITPLR